MNKRINKIRSLCQMYVAVSNPNFELWLLLHIQDIAGLSEEEMSNILRNKKNGSKRTHVEKLILGILGTYNKSNPLPERFLPFIDDAITRAKALDAANEEYPATVGSHVYKIVEKLIA